MRIGEDTDMKLYEATYEYQEVDSGNTVEQSLYILAPDFQTATRLAETNEKISILLENAGDSASTLARLELLAFDVVQE